MSDLFKDEKFEEFDEITQMIEPFESSLNAEIANFPEEIEFTTQDIINMATRSYYGGTTKDIGDLIRSKAIELGFTDLSSRASDSNFCKTFFKLEGKPGLLNLETGEFDGKIKLIKLKNGFEDNEIEQEMKNHLLASFNSNFRKPSFVNKARINEILDLFGSKEGVSHRSSREKVKSLYETYIKLMEDRSLNIKDVDLFKRFCLWNVKYIHDGTLPALSNITKIKIMMRSGQPIYSIKEDGV